MTKAKRTLINVVLLLCMVYILSSCGYFVKPEGVLNTFIVALRNKDWNKAWDLLSMASKKNFEDSTFTPIKKQIEKLTPEMRKRVHPGLGVSADQVIAMDIKQFFGLFMEKSGVGEQIGKTLDHNKFELETAKIGKDKATIKIKGMPDSFELVKEKGTWKVDLR